MYGPSFIAPEDIFLQNVPLSAPPSALLDFTHRYEFPENPLDVRSTQGTLSSFSTAHYDSAPLSFSPQTVIPVNDGAGPCAIYSVSTLPLLPISASQTAPSYPASRRKIPQTIYDKKQWDFRPSEPILFHVNGRPGVNMGDAFRKKFTGVDGRDDIVLQDTPGAISCRLWVRSSRQLLLHTSVDGLINSSPATRSIARPR